MPVPSYTRCLSEIRIADVAEVGGKNASLGELYAMLTREGVRVPNGFAFTASAYRDALTAAGAWAHLHGLLVDLDKSQIECSPSAPLLYFERLSIACTCAISRRWLSMSSRQSF